MHSRKRPTNAGRLKAISAGSTRRLIISSPSQAGELDLQGLPGRVQPGNILMCDPLHFKVIDVKNQFMQGNIGRVQPAQAHRQWQALKDTFVRLGCTVHVVPSQPELEDMVFTANHVLLGQGTGGNKYVVPSHMVYPSRQKEIPFLVQWFKNNHYQVLELPRSDAGCYFEGQGDALWHPGKQLLWCGWGQRTSEGVYHHLSKLLKVPLITLHLIHPRFYHLDTAFCPLDIETVMYFPQAFDSNGNALIHHFFKRVIEVTADDAEMFACNALAVGKNVVIQAGCTDTKLKLKEHGFTPVEVDTAEFRKSGGSVSCLKMLVY